MPTFQERRGRDGKLAYRVMIRLKGYPPETATFDRKTDAKIWATQTEAAIREGRYFKVREAKRHTLTELIDKYKLEVLPTKKQNSRHSQGPQLDWWKERLGAYSLDAVTPPLIVQARNTLLKSTTRFKKPMTPSTVIRYLAILSHLFTVAIKEWQWTVDNPVRMISKPKESQGRIRFLNDAERKKLLDACKVSSNTCLYDIVLLAISTGMRYSEILGLTWDRVDLDRHMITLVETKNGQVRGVPIVGPALDALIERSRIRRLDTSLVFPSPTMHGKNTQPYLIRRAWKRAVKAAELEDFHFHDLRHTAASYLAMNGATPSELAEILGHKTLQMVKRYSHLSHEHTRKIVERMNMAVFQNIGTGGTEESTGS